MNQTQDRTLEAGDLRVDFTWREDRFTHQVSSRQAGVWTARLASIDGTPLDTWPASPPFQSLHIEHRDDGRTLALLVGMAGKSHWSASVEIDATARCVYFDVACRVREPAPGWLGSSYQLPPAGGEPGNRLAIEPTHRFGPAALQQHAGHVAIVAAALPQVSPQSVRWDYRLRLA